MNYGEEQAVRKIARQERDGGMALFFSFIIILFVALLGSGIVSSQEEKNHAMDYRIKRMEQRIYKK